MSDAALAWRQFRLERKMFWRNPSAAFFSFLLPLLFLFLFGSIASGDTAKLQIIIPGIAGLSIMATTFNALAMNITFLREQGVLKRVRGTPLPTVSYLTGVLGNAATNAAIQLVIVVLASKLVFGLPWPADLLTLVVFGIASVVCMASLGVAFSHLIPNFDAAPAYTNIVFLPVIFISGVFYDVKNVPTFLHDIANALPLVHIINGLKAGLVTGQPVSDHWDDLGAIALWAAVGIVFAVRGFAWESKRS